MKILLRHYQGNYYVWKDAKWEGVFYKLLDNDEACFYETEVLAVKDDNRIGYVQCNYCGELIENNPEAIEAHYAKSEAKKDCLKCEYLAPYGRKQDVTKTYVDNGDGTYSIKEEYKTPLACTLGYYTEDINSENAKKNCQYTRCRRKGVKPIKDTFIKYPGLFNKQITADTLKAKKYEFERYSNGMYEYDLKMRGTVKACVNEMGIVDHFMLYIRGWAYTFYYSDTYNKLFFYDYHKYNDDTSDYLTSAKEAKILEKITQLYEEVNENE